jgi:hypothetical protein
MLDYDTGLSSPLAIVHDPRDHSIQECNVSQLDRNTIPPSIDVISATKQTYEVSPRLQSEAAPANQ